MICTLIHKKCCTTPIRQYTNSSTNDSTSKLEISTMSGNAPHHLAKPFLLIVKNFLNSIEFPLICPSVLIINIYPMIIIIFVVVHTVISSIEYYIQIHLYHTFTVYFLVFLKIHLTLTSKFIHTRVYVSLVQVNLCYIF